MEQMRMIPTFDDVMRLTSTISSYEVFQPAECQAMYDTLLQLPDGATVVEVGCDYGRSSSLIFQVAKAKNFLSIHIDPWLDHPDRAQQWMEVMVERCTYHPFHPAAHDHGGSSGTHRTAHTPWHRPRLH